MFELLIPLIGGIVLGSLLSRLHQYGWDNIKPGEIESNVKVDFSKDFATVKVRGSIEDVLEHMDNFSSTVRPYMKEAFAEDYYGVINVSVAPRNKEKEENRNESN
jgi:hypothetical protein